MKIKYQSHLYIFLLLLTLIILRQYIKSCEPKKKIKIFILTIFLLISSIVSLGFGRTFGDETCIYGKKKKFNGLYYNGCVDTFHLIHISLYAVIGLLMKDIFDDKFIYYEYTVVFLFSLAFELFEHYCFYGNVCFDTYCGRLEDPFLNLFGYVLGKKIAGEKNDDEREKIENK